MNNLLQQEKLEEISVYEACVKAINPFGRYAINGFLLSQNIN
jgi:hypothetical protein